MANCLRWDKKLYPNSSYHSLYVSRAISNGVSIGLPFTDIGNPKPFIFRSYCNV